MRVIIFNGPKASGKDEAVGYLNRQYDIYPFSFKEKLVRLVLEAYSIHQKDWDNRYTREGKEIPWSALGGKSQREALIHMSEVVIKPHFGNDFFGVAATKKLLDVFGKNSNEIVSCSDGGFDEEINPLMDQFGEENLFVVKILRPGYGFKGDSRNWIENDRVPEENYLTIHNSQDLKYLWQQLDDVYDYVLNK